MVKSYPRLIFFAARIFRKDILHAILEDCRKNLATIKKEHIWKEYVLCAPEELNIRGVYGETALHYASAYQYVEVARFLLEEGADANCWDSNYYSPLHLASCFENEEMCQLLVNFKANVNSCAYYSSVTPLNIVCGGDKKNFYKNLEHHYFWEGDINFNIKAFSFNTNIMKLLLKNGADPDKNVLFRLCKHGRMEDVKIFLEYGANIQALGQSDSVLHYAAQSSSLELVDFLLEKGFDVDLKGMQDYTPLMEAIGSNCLEMIEYLVDRGANVNATNKLGTTALIIAVRNNSEAVECLLELGADWTISDFCDFNRCYTYACYMQAVIAFTALRENKLSKHIYNYVKEDIFGDNDEIYEAFDYFDKSKREVSKLKTTVTKYNKTSYFDFLTKDFYTSVQIAKNSDVKAFFNPKTLKNEFPCYEELLKCRFKLTQDLEKFVDKSFDFFVNEKNLPFEVVEVIMRNFRSIDFRVFGRVLLNKRF